MTQPEPLPARDTLPQRIPGATFEHRMPQPPTPRPTPHTCDCPPGQPIPEK